MSIIFAEYIVPYIELASSEQCTTPLAFENEPNELMMENIDFFSLISMALLVAAHTEFGVF